MGDGDWVVAGSDGPGWSGPRQVIVGGEVLVVWRTARGRYVALTDSCPHQGTPLSAGVVAGESLVCAKHGWAVGSDGWCDQAGMATATHPVEIRGGDVVVRARARS